MGEIVPQYLKILGNGAKYLFIMNLLNKVFIVFI